jgi:hypothetical protein
VDISRLFISQSVVIFLLDFSQTAANTSAMPAKTSGLKSSGFGSFPSPSSFSSSKLNLSLNAINFKATLTERMETSISSPPNFIIRFGGARASRSRRKSELEEEGVFPPSPFSVRS